MPNVSVPPKTEFKPIPADIFEVFIDSVEAIPNPFYNPDTDSDGKREQLVWTFIIREDGEYKGSRLRYYTGASLGRHPRNKLTGLVKVVDKDFDIEVAYKNWDEFVDRLVNKPLRVTTEVVERKDGEGTYAKVSGILPSKMGEVSGAEILTLGMGAAETTDF